MRMFTFMLGSEVVQKPSRTGYPNQSSVKTKPHYIGYNVDFWITFGL